jgi:hypothetical protein
MLETAYNVKFNSSKCKYVYYDNNIGNNNEDMSISFNDIVIQSTKQEKHLGHVIGPNSMESLIQECTRDFYSKVNHVIAQISRANTQIKYKLFKSFCMPLYGCQIWDLSCKSIKSFYVAWRKCLRKLLQIPLRTHNALLHYICEDIPVDFQIFRRFIKFFRSLFINNNVYSRMCGLLALHGSMSATCNSLNFVCYKLKMDKYCLNSYNVNHIIHQSLACNSFNEMVHRKVVLINELLSIRDDLGNYEFDKVELDYMIEYMCTSDINML